jgi:hypothetical protein
MQSLDAEGGRIFAVVALVQKLSATEAGLDIVV